MEYPREVFEEVFSTQEALDELLKTEADLHVFTVGGFVAVHTCYGDICKIVCAIMNYASLMELVCDQWGLTGLHRITYETQAKKLRQIADKLQKCIGYDYEKALRKCLKKKQKPARDDGVGEEALVMAARGKSENGGTDGTH